MWQAVASLFKFVLKQEFPLKMDRRQYKSGRFTAIRVTRAMSPLARSTCGSSKWARPSRRACIGTSSLGLPSAALDG